MHDPRYTELRALLLAERERAGLSQEQLAGRLGKPHRYVSLYERGELRLDFVEYLDVARALGIDGKALFEKLLNRISWPRDA